MMQLDRVRSIRHAVLISSRIVAVVMMLIGLFAIINAVMAAPAYGSWTMQTIVAMYDCLQLEYVLRELCGQLVGFLIR